MCFGAFERICHWGPLIALSIIKAITIMTVACLSQWWPPWVTIGGSVLFTSFMSASLSTLYFFIQATFTGPGRLPKKWKPECEKEVAYLQYCSVCENYKAPRAHHCRKCGSCNMKMDHHCPWINNCVGHRNHASFSLFLFCAIVGCAQASVILSISIYRAIHRTWYLHFGNGTEPLIYMSLWELVLCMFVLGLAIGVVIAVGMLLFFQIRGILRNRTGVEDWIMEKAVHRRSIMHKPFAYPYNLGRWNNFKQVFTFTCIPASDGIIWPVIEGCNQYTLTLEQLGQKAQKRDRSRPYLISNNVSGYWFPVVHGCGVCFHPPCTDEPRIQLVEGDSVIVTRWKKYWLYGELVVQRQPPHNTNKSQSRVRGWFPRTVAVELQEAYSTNFEEDNHYNENIIRHRHDVGGHNNDLNKDRHQPKKTQHETKKKR